MAALTNELIIGSLITPLFSFDNSTMAHINGIFSVDVIGNEMAVDTVTAVVRYTGDDDIRGIPYGTPAWWYNDGGLVCAAYVRNVERTGKFLYKLTLISGVGLLENIMHPGGVYNGEPFEDVVTEIIAGAFAFTTDADVATLPVYGWLPYDTARNNLHQLLFATGVTLRKSPSGDPRFVFLSDNNPRPVPDSRIAFGGSVDYQTIASGVEVTEHSFGVAPGTPESLFDNTASAMGTENTLVVFSGPYSALTPTGSLTIEESGVNYAIVSGIGTLTGVPYSHFTRVITRSNPDAIVDNVKRVTDFTLVNMANSINVAKRVLAYYASARTIRSQLVMDGEKCGDILALSDPYREGTTAFLAEADVNASTNLLAACRLVEGYTPTGQGNNYDTYLLLTGSGTWTVPDGVTEITIVLIGGGDGGMQGSKGGSPPTLSVIEINGDEPSPHRAYIDPATAGPSSGGSPGAAGAGGNVYGTTMAVTPGDVISYASGLGGLGGIYLTDTRPTTGTDTVFGALTSALGSKIPSGYADPITGNVYGATGVPGTAGGKGGGLVYDTYEGYKPYSETVQYEGVIYNPGQDGQYAENIFDQRPGLDRVITSVSFGGFGGGAAAGSDGGDGADGYAGNNVAHAPTGGDGATAVKPAPPALYGQGGGGGNGGGGAGQNGAGGTEDATLFWVTGNTVEWGPSTIGLTAATPVIGTPGTPGDGSDGGDGADGCIEIYYKAPLPVILSVNSQGHAIANNAEYLGDDTLKLVPTQEANGGHLLYTEV